MNTRCIPLIMVYFSTCICVLVHAQDQLGFISIDCGAPKSYTDATTGLFYTTDEQYTTTGTNRDVLAPYNQNNETQFLNLRSFPGRSRNCYTLPLSPPSSEDARYLIRARFMYGNYDSENLLPQFDLYVGVKFWETIRFADASTIVTKELMYMPTSTTVYICLVNVGLGTPFISALELRAHENTQYDAIFFGSLTLVKRVDFGNDNRQIRYPNDAADRIWEPYPLDSKMSFASSSFPENVTFLLDTPKIVMETAATPANSSQPLQFNWKLTRSSFSGLQFIYVHISDVQKLSKPKQIREFNITINGYANQFSIVTGYTEDSSNNYLDVWDVKKQDWINISMVRTARSTLPPIINAAEIYDLRDFFELETQQLDALAITKIRQTYKIVKDWIADPCAPQNHSWEGLGCTFNGTVAPPRIISLNLSSNSLVGNISEDFFNLKVLERLDLSNNNISGPIPDFLAQLKFLRILNLRGNKLSGAIPVGLRKRSQQGFLRLSVEGNQDLCLSESCPTTTAEAEAPSINKRENNMKRKTSVILIIASISGAALLLLAAITAFLWKCRKERKNAVQSAADLAANIYHTEGNLNSCEDQNERVGRNISFMTGKKRFSYSDILHITNNFEKVLGEGGFGTVYYGHLDNSTEVAVKMLKRTLSEEGYEQFHTEAEILLVVHHTNLASMIGYYHEGKHLGVIYEYMSSGNLEDYLSSIKTKKCLSWEERLQIAVDAAQGLEYLHHGCIPPIVHRDVKSTNILLNENLRAKISDFGISKTFPDDQCTHISTEVKGTPGYLDPEYFGTQQLNEKSDVFGYGVVLFEILTGKRAINKSDDGEIDHISNWVRSIIETKGDVRNAVDSRLENNFDLNSAWKLVEIATACVSAKFTERPTMKVVVIDLKQCLNMEKARKHRSSDSTEELILLNISSTHQAPSAR